MCLKKRLKGNVVLFRTRKNNLRLLGIVLKRQQHLSSLFLLGKNTKLAKIKQVHYKKLHALGKDSSIGAHDPDKAIFNYSLISKVI